MINILGIFERNGYVWYYMIGFDINCNYFAMHVINIYIYIFIYLLLALQHCEIIAT